MKGLLFDLTRHDFKSRYLGSHLGLIWAFVQPSILLLIMWFVFQIGFKSAPLQDVPFILWLMCGMIPWFFLSDSIITATNAVIDQSFLVKKVVFRVSILPIVKILSALIVHMFFIVILCIMFICYGYSPSPYWLQSIYYLIGAIAFVLGLSWITSSVVVFARDIAQFIGIILQLAFWGTPIFWSLDTVPQQYRWLFKLNPVYYVIEGYRDSFIRHTTFWHHPVLSLYFWSITVVLLIIGAFVFRKLRPHFADVL